MPFALVLILTVAGAPADDNPILTDVQQPAIDADTSEVWKTRIEAGGDYSATVAAQPARCASDILCMTRLAEENDARFVFWTEASPVRVRWVIYDVRTGKRKIKRILPNIDFNPDELDTFFDEAVPATAYGARFCIIGVYDEGEPSLKDLYRTDIPWTLYGSILLAGGGGVFVAGGVVLFMVAGVYATGVLPDAAGAPGESATLLALSGMMTTLLGAGLLVFGAMGGTFWLLEEGPLAKRSE